MSDLKVINYPIPANTFADTGKPIERNSSGIPVVDAYAANPDQALAGQIFSTNGEAEAEAKADTKKPGKKGKAAEQEPEGEAEAEAKAES